MSNSTNNGKMDMFILSA